MTGELEEQTVAQKLLLGAGAVEVTQPLPMGAWNLVQVLAWIESETVSLGTDPVEVRLQVSPDLDFWENVSGVSLTLSTAPKSGTVSTFAYSPIVAPYGRLHFTGGGAAVLMGASLRFGRT